MKPPIDFEHIAAQIHEYYFRQYGGFLPATFAELPEYMKADNRAAARRISDVLAIAGLRIVARDGRPWTDEERALVLAIMEENIERLAEAEHDGWVDTRLLQGWKRTTHPKNAVEKRANFDLRRHHLLIPYDKLPDSEKKKDRDVRNYVEIIAATEYRIEMNSKTQP